MELNFYNFEQHLVKNFCISKLKTVAIAVSGGVDSMCLAFLLNKICKLNNIIFTAITVDHKLRKDSTFEANEVARYLKNQHINHVILTWEHETIKSDIQNKARQARYKLICDYCKDHNIENLFVAHTYDDQAETVLLRILRGSGIDGISGIEFKTKINEINVIRPFLQFRKSQILSFMKDQNIFWLEDKSNKEVKFDRVKVRNLISKCDKDFKFTQRLNLLSENARRARNFFESYLKEIFKKYCTIGDLGFISIGKTNFIDHHEEIKLRLINYIIKYVKNDFDNYPIRIEQLKYILRNLNNLNQQKFTISGCIILIDQIVIYFYKEPKFIESTKILKKGKNIWDGRYIIETDSENLEVYKLTKEKWSEIRPKNYTHTIPGDMIFSTPVVFSKSRNLYILPLSNIIYSLSNIDNYNLQVTVTHILSETCFVINY